MQKYQPGDSQGYVISIFCKGKEIYYMPLNHFIYPVQAFKLLLDRQICKYVLKPTYGRKYTFNGPCILTVNHVPIYEHVELIKINTIFLFQDISVFNYHPVPSLVNQSFFTIDQANILSECIKSPFKLK